MESEILTKEPSSSASRFTRSIITETPANDKIAEMKEKDKSTGGGRKRLLPTFLPSQDGNLRRSLPEPIIKCVSSFCFSSSYLLFDSP
jgi:hypothetical protein